MSALTLLALVVAIGACTTTTGKVRVERRYAVHSFAFDALRDSKEIELLDYQYGLSDFHGVRACPRHRIQCKVVPQTGSTYGAMEVGDRLYVKWRIRSTGEVYEDTAYFGDRIPSDMDQKKVYFIVTEKALSVFLIGYEEVIPNPCPTRAKLREIAEIRSSSARIFSKYCYFQILTLYPDPSIKSNSEGVIWESLLAY